ncbi:hypothetical protein QUB20_26970 [Microcoleus sp. B4-C2]
MSPVYQIFNIITAKDDRAVPFPYPKRAIGRLPKSRSHISTKTFCICGRSPRPDPPKSPLRRGVGVDFEKILVPPLVEGGL